MSLTKEILRTTARYYPLGYKELYEYLYDETVYGKKLNKKSLRVTLSKMRRNGLLKNREGKWAITTEGEELLKVRNSDIKRFFPGLKSQMKNLPRNLIVIFDIPEKKKRYREWLRSELVGFGFEMVQKSVWLGPNLPKEFVEYLNETEVLKYLRFFRATEKDLI